MSYFNIIPVEIVDIVMSKVDDLIEEDFAKIYPDIRLNHDRIFKLRFSYLSNIAKFKHELCEDYVKLSVRSYLHDFFVNGYMCQHFIWNLYHVLEDFDIRGYEIRPAMVPIIIDTYKRNYPKIFLKLKHMETNLDLQHLMVGLHFIHPWILHEANEDRSGLMIRDIDDIFSDVIDEFNYYKEEYVRFIPDVNPDDLDIIFGVILQMVHNYYKENGLDTNILWWATRYINLYKESIKNKLKI